MRNAESQLGDKFIAQLFYRLVKRNVIQIFFRAQRLGYIAKRQKNRSDCQVPDDAFKRVRLLECLVHVARRQKLFQLVERIIFQTHAQHLEIKFFHVHATSEAFLCIYSVALQLLNRQHKISSLG